MLRRIWVALSVTLLLAGCGDDRTGDAGPADAGAADASTDSGTDAGVASCMEQLMDQRVPVDITGVVGHIHPSVTWDGEGIWIVYNRPNAMRRFDVYAARMDCAGELLVQPFSVSSAPAVGNDVDPELLLLEDRFVVAWNPDNGLGGMDNLSIRYRVFDMDGTPRGDDQTLATRYDGVAVGPANELGVQMARATDGGFWIGGARGLPGVIPGFSAYAQNLDADGAPTGPTLAPSIDEDASQTKVDVAVSTAGETWLAYDRTTFEPETEHVWVSRDGMAPEMLFASLDSSSSPSILPLGDAVWVAAAGLAGGETDIRIVDVAADGSAPVIVGEPGRVDFLPRLAGADDGTFAVAFFRQVRGFNGELQVARVTPGNPPTLGPVLRADEANAPGYQPAITHVAGDWWFVVYAEGTSPDFNLVGRFMELPSGA
ncbi:MAG: hypothetical protein AB8I08_29445 [Sandaracinaceae bacterium]